MDQVPISDVRHSQEGFTLVELSIVLVVIGLLVGGILAAQSMIDSAKINAQIRQLQQIDVAVQNFVTTYSRLPGDDNKNGVLDSGGGQVEYAYFFDEMSSMQGFPGHYNGASGGGFTSPRQLFGDGFYGPKAAIGKSGIIAKQATNLNIWYAIEHQSACTLASAGNCDVDAFSPSQALALDKKLDDGNGYTGNVLLMNNTIDYGAYYSTPSRNNIQAGGCYNPNSWGDGSTRDPHNPDLNGVPCIVQQNGDWCADQNTGVYSVSQDNHWCGLQFKSNVTIP